MPWTPPNPPRDFVYKTASGVPIRLSLYLPSSAHPKPAAGFPVIIWFHPGSWVDGSRGDISRVQVATALDAGWAFVSADYRLAPQVRVPDQLEDAKDAIAWVRARNLEGVDALKLVVAGSSAGGLIALLAAHQLAKPPLAMYAVYPGCDLTLPGMSQKVQFPAPIAWEDVKGYLDPSGPVISNSPGDVDFATFTPRGRTRAAFYLSQEGNAVEYILPPGEEPAPYDAKKQLKPWSRIVIIHGTSDKMVPYEVSTQLVNALKEGGNEHLLITTEGDHGFDLGVDPEDAEGRKPFEQAVEWLGKFL
ncbi:alpha/beta-hydrolase [Dacryopinax primogenitus]|uniref:Alpha/beta-hydrolase n=1 Tax=Dacryopinax primogenitus (strain DJM 731) TaxID=1858805 RepID=M5GGD3_DACPD|nr:alpha/beta-hydrolase [Dacryopinax primogenitus]EJU05288.1 alpha/beta-hydrolase [Dacryopinax primogenitus]